MTKTKVIRIDITDYEKILQLQQKMSCNTLLQTVTTLLQLVTDEKEKLLQDDFQDTEVVETDSFTFYKPKNCECSVCESVKQSEYEKMPKKEIGWF